MVTKKPVSLAGLGLLQPKIAYKPIMQSEIALADSHAE
jgi:hypothetical protein